MKFIDWCNAPHDAEAGTPDCSQFYACWYKRNQWGDVMVIIDGEGVDWVHMGGRKDFPCGHQLRPDITPQ
jgi:hypothetical protein